MRISINFILIIAFERNIKGFFIFLQYIMKKIILLNFMWSFVLWKIIQSLFGNKIQKTIRFLEGGFIIISFSPFPHLKKIKTWTHVHNYLIIPDCLVPTESLLCCDISPLLALLCDGATHSPASVNKWIRQQQL